MAMPHPNVYAAAADPVNGILQPTDLDGVGEYAVRASVVSPAVNVLCANLARDELAPLVYTTWPAATTNTTIIPGQLIGFPGWQNDVPSANTTEFLNRTVVDDLFRWGPQYSRRPPVFQLVRFSLSCPLCLRFRTGPSGEMSSYSQSSITHKQDEMPD